MPTINDIESVSTDTDIPATPDASTVPVQARRNIAIQRRSAVDLPADLVEAFHAKARSIRWGAREEIMQALDDTLGWNPVLYSELKESEQELVKSGPFRINGDDTITRGDMLLQWRTFAARDEQSADEAYMRSVLEDPGYQIADFEDQTGFTPARGTQIPAIRDAFVKGLSDDAREAAQEVAERVAARRK